MTAHLDEEILSCLALEESDGDAVQRAHLEVCAQCSERLDESRDVLRRIDDARGVIAPTREELTRLRARVMTSLTPRLDVWTGLAVVGAGLVVLASRVQSVALERALPSVIVILAAGLAAAWSSRGPRSTLAALLAGSVVVGAIDLATLGEIVGTAVGCERFLAVAAIVPALSAVYASRRAARDAGERGHAAAVGAAAGALAAQGALLTWCSHEAGLPHVLVFHVLVVLVVTALAGAAGRLAPLRTA